MWTLLDVQRHAEVLLCFVRWVCPRSDANPFAVADVSLTESAVQWKHYATKAEANKESRRRGGAQLCPSHASPANPQQVSQDDPP